jgi:hypothetical protein
MFKIILKHFVFVSHFWFFISFFVLKCEKFKTYPAKIIFCNIYQKNRGRAEFRNPNIYNRGPYSAH